MIKKIAILICCLLGFTCIGIAQELIGPVQFNAALTGQRARPLLKTTTISLPFFDDFSINDVYPDNLKWVDRSVYINNTMAVNPISRGVATFDALNAQGGPYDSSNYNALLYADSLTSQPFDLSTNVPGDSIYLSFFYQPQGKGSVPEPQDSLILFFKKHVGGWTPVWSKEGSPLQSFQQVMVAVKDTAFLYNGFQFRFINKASLTINDDQWNIDYVRMAANRNINDTSVNDIAVIDQPSNLLNDYTSMPYRQFQANVNGELASQHTFNVRNAYNNQRSFVYGYTAREQLSNTPLFTSAVNNSNIPAYTIQQYQFPVYNINYAAPNNYSRVVLENKYYAGEPSGTDVKGNDTIVGEQVFDNYLAYDDGTAERGYILIQSPTLPAKTAIEFHLNQADTLRGVAIYFARQIPMGFNKFFSVAVYKNIVLDDIIDTVVFQQDLYFPGYVDTVNHFWVYKFDNPVPLNAGTFFLGTVQPAQSGSDSLALGVDMNRAGGNHLYFNADGYWHSSILNGALMVRPLFGQPIIGTGIEQPVAGKSTDWSIYPNPANDKIKFKMAINSAIQYQVVDMQGRLLLTGQATSGEQVNISTLSPGIYFVRIFAGAQWSVPRKIIKL